MRMEETTSTSGAYEFNANSVASTILKYIGLCFSVINSSTWVIVSGASDHMCFNSTSLTSMTPIQISLTISLPNCHTIQATYVGTV